MCPQNGSNGNGHHQKNVVDSKVLLDSAPKKSKKLLKLKGKKYQCHQESPQQIWAKVVEKAKPPHRDFLSRAELIQLDKQQATLAVEVAYLNKFKRRKKSLESILDRTLGYSVTVVIQEQN